MGWKLEQTAQKESINISQACRSGVRKAEDPLGLSRKAQIDKALSSLVWPQNCPCFWQGVGLKIFRGLFQPQLFPSALKEALACIILICLILFTYLWHLLDFYPWFGAIEWEHRFAYISPESTENIGGNYMMQKIRKVFHPMYKMTLKRPKYFSSKQYKTKFSYYSVVFSLQIAFLKCYHVFFQ